MNDGWVKLHRKTLTNPMWKHDHTAIHIFMTLLLLCDKGSGSWSGGRYQLSEVTGVNNATLYKALLRLKKAKMVTLSSNNKYTVISICKWKDYQAGGNSSGNNKVTTNEQQSNNKVTTNEQQSNTLTRIEKKEYIDTKVSIAKTPEYGKPEINELFGEWEKRLATKLLHGLHTTAGQLITCTRNMAKKSC